jgi:sugar transferase (PEP-CTERM/EpsH1 system associated)
MEPVRPINVLHLIQGLESGGLETVTVSLLERLDRTLYQPSICCFDNLGSLMERIKGKIKVHFLQRRQGIDYTYPIKLARLLKKEQIEILHLHNSTAFFYGVLAGKIAGVPVIIYTEHARDIFPSMRVRIADKALSLFTHRIVVVAEYLKRNLVRYEKFNPKKITVIYNGVDPQKFNGDFDSRAVKKTFDIDEDRLVIGIVARLDPIKNHKCLLRAMKMVVAELPKTILLIVGDGPFLQELKSFINTLSLNSYVRFLGMRSDIPELMSIMDVFVLCSLSEGLPLTLLEAMASGRAIIATNVGGIPEVIEHGINGLLVEPDNHRALTEAIIQLLRDKSLAKRISESARNKLMENFTLDKMTEKYKEIYQDCISNYIKNNKKSCAA